MSYDLKKLAYQLKYRGSKELDFLCSKINLCDFFEDELSQLTLFLNESEADLERWLVKRETPPDLYKNVCEKILKQILKRRESI